MRARAIRGVHTSPMWYGEVTQPAARPGAAFEPFFAEEVEPLCQSQLSSAELSKNTYGRTGNIKLALLQVTLPQLILVDFTTYFFALDPATIWTDKYANLGHHFEDNSTDGAMRWRVSIPNTTRTNAARSETRCSI